MRTPHASPARSVPSRRYETWCVAPLWQSYAGLERYLTKTS